MEKQSMWKSILVRTIAGVLATVIGTVLAIWVCQWLGLGAVLAAGARRMTRNNS